MTQNKTIRVGRREWKITAALMLVIAASYVSAIATYDFGFLPGVAGGFVAMLGSMYIVSQVTIVERS